MRYSKTRIITTTIISISCFLLVVFAIYKGIEFAKQANGAEEPSAKANIAEKKVIKNNKKKVEKNTKETTKTTTSKESTTKKKETKTEKNKVVVKKADTTNEPVKKQETPKQEIKEEEGPTFDEGIVGKYVIKELTYDGKTYTKKEINKLIKEGYSMNLEIKKNGLADLSVLSINKIYEVDDTYFNDGQNQIEYSHSNTRIRITIDNAKMLFIKI